MFAARHLKHRLNEIRKNIEWRNPKKKLEKVLKSLTFAPGPLRQLRFRLELSPAITRDGTRYVNIFLDTEDTKTGSPTTVVSYFWMDPAAPVNAIQGKIRGCIKEIVCHEVDEGLLFNGKRVFDPHGFTYEVGL